MTAPIRRVATDFDGTIFAEFENPPVAATFCLAVRDLQARGASWVINTGRDLGRLMENFARTKLGVAASPGPKLAPAVSGTGAPPPRSSPRNAPVGFAVVTGRLHASRLLRTDSQALHPISKPRSDLDPKAHFRPLAGHSR